MDRHAALAIELGELDDQDRVLGRQADQGDQADLPVHVEVEAGQQDRDQRAEHAERRREQHCERHRPALVQRRQEQEHHHHRQRHHQCRGVAGLDFLGGLPRPLVAVAGRQHLGGDLAQRLQRIAGAVPRCLRAGHLGAAVQVVAHGEARADAGRGGHHRIQRHHLAVAVAHEQRGQGRDVAAELGVGLHRHAVVLAEAGEVVHLQAAQEDLQRAEHVGDGNAELLDLLAVDGDAVVGRRRGVGRGDAADLRPLLRGLDELRRHLRQFLRALAVARLQHHREARHRTEAGQGRRVERDRDRLGRLRADAHRLLDQRVDLLLLLLAILPGLELDHHHRGVGRGGAGNDVVAGDAEHRIDAIQSAQLGAELVDDVVGALGRGRVGQDRLHEERADVLVRHEAGRSDAEQQEQTDQQRQHHHHDVFQRAGAALGDAGVVEA